MKKALVLLIVLLIMLPGIVFATGQPEAEEKKVEVFSWWTAGGEAEGLEAMIEIFKQQNPGVEFINATVAGGAGQNAMAVLATRMQGGEPPDSFQVHAGLELIGTWVVADAMEPLNFLFEENGWMDKFPEGVIDIISYEGNIYSVPVNIHRSNVLWYNKAIFDELGLTAPATIEEFFAVAETLKANGITPLALGDNGIWASVHLFESVLLGTLGPEMYKGLWTGDTAWDGPETIEAIETFIEILSYVNTDHAALSWDEAAQYVIDGTCAMTIMGDWAHGYFMAKGLEPGVDYGWVPSPGTSGSFIMLSDSFGLPKNAPHREYAIAWLTVCGSIEGQDAFNPLKGSIPARIDGDTSLYDVYLLSAMDDFATNSIVPSVAHGAAAPQGWVTKLNDVMTILVSAQNVQEAAKEFAQIASEFTGK